MTIKVLIHDLSMEEIQKLGDLPEKYCCISADVKAAPCQGCFGCWAKSAGKCVYKDKLQYIAAIIAQSEEIIIISKNCYGSYSPGIKKILDRSVAESVFLFTYRGGRMHHVTRYKNKPRFTAYMYGDMSDFEKQIAKEVAKANKNNFNYQCAKSIFVSDVAEIKGEL